MVELSLLSIKCYKCISVICTADNDLVAGYGAEIICVHWLSVLFHNVVCYIDKVVNRTDSL